MSHCYGYNSYSELLDAARKEREEKARQLEIADLKYRIRERENECFKLQKQVQELEKALIKLVKIEVRLPECAVCWERDRCTDRSHGDNCLAIEYIVDTAKEAAKETKV